MHARTIVHTHTHIHMRMRKAKLAHSMNMRMTLANKTPDQLRTYAALLQLQSEFRKPAAFLYRQDACTRRPLTTSANPTKGSHTEPSSLEQSLWQRSFCLLGPSHFRKTVCGCSLCLQSPLAHGTYPLFSRIGNYIRPPNRYHV